MMSVGLPEGGWGQNNLTGALVIELSKIYHKILNSCELEKMTKQFEKQNQVLKFISMNISTFRIPKPLDPNLQVK